MVLGHVGGPGGGPVVLMSLDHHVEWLLWHVKPAHVVLYDHDLAFVRQLEVYQVWTGAIACS